MKKGAYVGSEFVIECIHCGKDYNLHSASRNTKKKDLVRCPHCGCIVEKH